MKHKLLYSALALIVLSLISGYFANAASYVDADGFLHETLWTPIAGLTLFIGGWLLIIAFVRLAYQQIWKRMSTA